MSSYKELRAKYPTFTYEGYDVKQNDKEVEITYHFAKAYILAWNGGACKLLEDSMPSKGNNKECFAWRRPDSMVEVVVF